MNKVYNSPKKFFRKSKTKPISYLDRLIGNPFKKAKSTMDPSKFNLWRASFSFCFVDGFLAPEEKAWIEEKMNALKFTEKQRSILMKDLVSPPNVDDLLPLITNLADRGFLVNQIRFLSKIDQELSPEEVAKIDKVKVQVLAKVDLVQLDKVIHEVEQASHVNEKQLKVYNKRSYTERLINGLISKFPNRL